MARLINFFIDESGSASPKTLNSNLYILSGIMVDSQSRENLKIRADQIKFKYWNHTDVIFHSREIGRKEGDFKILKDTLIEKNFNKDLFTLLNMTGYQLFAIVIDKKKIPKNWTEKTIYKLSSEIIIQNYILALLAKKTCKGRLVIESATSEKDFYYHKAAGHFLANGFPEININYQQVQDTLTEIAFVTKKNHDIEEQIADLLAYGLKLKYEKSKRTIHNEYQNKILQIVEQKLFKFDAKNGEKKKKFYSKISSYHIVP